MDSVKEAIRLVQSFCQARDWDQFHNPKDLAIGLSTESNELLDIFRFQSEEDMARIMADPQMREAVGQELADIFFFLLRFAQMNDFDLLEVLKNKIALNDRKYPVDEAKGQNYRYKDLHKEKRQSE